MPEVRFKEPRGELVGDRGPSKKLFRFDRQAPEVKNDLLAQTKTRTIDPVTIPKQAGFGGGLHRLVPVEYLLRHRFGPIESRNR